MSNVSKLPREKWRKTEEKVLLNLVNKADNGLLRKVVVEANTNVRMSRFDPWERVT